jgi:hypothetical protein
VLRSWDSGILRSRGPVFVANTGANGVLRIKGVRGVL